MPIGASLYDERGAALVTEIMELAKEKGVEITLPVDFVTASEFGEGGEIGAATLEGGVPDGMMGLDCGPRSSEINASVVSSSKTILWNGARLAETSRDWPTSSVRVRWPPPRGECHPSTRSTVHFSRLVA